MELEKVAEPAMVTENISDWRITCSVSNPQRSKRRKKR
jgi:hypothetical protein